MLEVGDRQYTLRFGGHRVIKGDILSPTSSNPDATLIANLSHTPEIPDETFDCIILTQVLHIVYDFAAVMATLRRLLKPGGVALLTLPSITQAQQDYEWPFLWGFTGESARRLTEDAFGAGQAEISVYGNVLSATAFLYGLSFHELSEAELHHIDSNYQVIIGVRAVKPS